MAEIAPGIVGVAIKAEQLSPLLAEASDLLQAGGDAGPSEANPMARSVKVLAILIRELAEAFDDRDSMYPRGMKHCARLVLEDCNALCDELRALVSPPLDQDGRPGERQPIGKAKIDQLQTELDLQKAMLVATTALASFTRQVIYTSDTHETSDERHRSIEQKRAEVEVAIAKAIKWDKMRILQEDMEGSNQPAAPAGEQNRPQNPIKRASFALTPEEEQRYRDSQDAAQDGRQSPRSFQSNTTLQNLLTYWRELQDMSIPEHPEQDPDEVQGRDEGWEDLGDGIQRYESRDAGTQDERGHARHAATAMEDEDAPRHWLPRSPPRDHSPSVMHPSPKHHHPGALRSLVRADRTPSPQYEGQNDRHIPPSPPYSAGSAADDEHHLHNVHHHRHIHHHEHHHTTHRRRRTPPPQTPPRPAVTDREEGQPVDMAEDFWHILQANGGIHWELRKKRGDRLVVREYIGPVLARQGETSWSHLTVSGSVWTSLPRKYCSRAILLDLPYDFKEDEQFFHIIEELEYSQVEEIIRLSLRTMGC